MSSVGGQTLQRKLDMKMLQEFRAFAFKDIIMPPIGVAVGGVDFSELSIVLKEAAGETAAVTIGYGAFIQTLVDFLIVAMAIFVAIKVINSMQRKKPEAPAAPLPPSEELMVLREIRDALKRDD